MIKVRFCKRSVDIYRSVAAAAAFVPNSRDWLFQCHRLAIQRGVYPRSAKVSLVVGTVLNVINQPEWLFGLAPLHSIKLLFTYLVPFLVATYGAVMAFQASADQGCDPVQTDDQ